MLRSFGGTSFTTSPSIRISPPLMSSSPAIIAQRRALAAARRADEDDELLVLDVEVDAADRRRAVVVLRERAQRDVGHRLSLWLRRR